MFQTQKVLQTIVLVVVHKKDIMTWRVLLSAGEEFSLKLHVSDIFESIHSYLFNVWSVGTYQLLGNGSWITFLPAIWVKEVIYAKPTGIKY